MTAFIDDLDRPLSEPHALDPSAIASLRLKGHAVVRGLASASEIAAYRPAIEAAVLKYAERAAPLSDRDTYGKAFLQVPNLWMRSEVVREFVYASRFAKVAAELLGVSGVRLYHDQALYKEPGGGHTPWHQDQNYWPLDTNDTITMWMPLVDIPAEVGSMTFANGSHLHGDLGPWIIGDESEAAFSDLVAREGYETETHGAMRAGDATFHKGWTLHRAPANNSNLLRSVMTIIWYADGTKVGAIDSPARKFDHQIWLSGKEPGTPADGPINPRLWPPSEANVGEQTG